MNNLKKVFTLTLVVLLLIMAVALSSMNAESVTLKLHWFEFNWPLGFMVLVFTALGLLVGLVLSWLLWLWPSNRQKVHWQRAYFKLKHETEEAEKNQNSTSKDLANIS